MAGGGLSGVKPFTIMSPFSSVTSVCATGSPQTVLASHHDGELLSLKLVRLVGGFIRILFRDGRGFSVASWRKRGQSSSVPPRLSG